MHSYRNMINNPANTSFQVCSLLLSRAQRQDHITSPCTPLKLWPSSCRRPDPRQLCLGLIVRHICTLPLRRFVNSAIPDNYDGRESIAPMPGISRELRRGWPIVPLSVPSPSRLSRHLYSRHHSGRLCRCEVRHGTSQ